MFVYALDDPYIHLAMARNLVEHGTWGLNAGEIEPASSSPAWTLILAMCFGVVGTSALMPFWLNLFAGVVIVLTTGALLRTTIPSEAFRLFALLIFICLLPLPPLIFIGMEHSLHVWLAILLGWTVASRLASDGRFAWWSNWLCIALLAALNVAFRFDALSLVGAAVLALFVARMWRVAIAVACAGWMPVIVYAAVAYAHGAMLLPHSIILKSGHISPLDGGQFIQFLLHIPNQLPNPLYIAMICILLGTTTLMCLPLRQRSWGRVWANWALFVFAVGSVIHMQFSALGGFRYEAYLLGVAMVASIGKLAMLTSEWRCGALRLWESRTAISRALVVVVVGAILFSMAVSLFRGVTGIVRVPGSVRNIYEQQIQMTALVRKVFSQDVVAVNDIGAVAYYGENPVLDLWGLADSEVANLRIEGAYDTESIDRIANERDVSMAMVYDRWFERYGGVPEHWISGGQWTIQNNLVCGHHTVSLYVVDDNDSDRIIREIKKFNEKHLPPSVIVVAPEGQ